ncbi:MAG: carboxypeptidase-like regulatory domain-containing protein [Kordia sp.]|uniref:T9SS type A sorting domain-containing protein n=1 Tax=Kordia sp. TaxID=1965332 RepID=UPI00385EDC2C
MKTKLLFGLFFTISVCCFAQKRTITGTIYDEDKNVLADANVIVKNSDKGTITDEKGQFALDANSKDTLIISYLGFETKEIIVSEQNEISITLIDAFEMMETTEIIGYDGVKYKVIKTNCNWSVIDSQKIETTEFKRIPSEQRLTSLFPNPAANGIFQLQLNENYTKLTLEVYTMNGQLLQSNTYTKLSKNPQIDLSKQSKGIYLVRIITDGSVLETKKAIRS